jgi:hypothetical protein
MIALPEVPVRPVKEMRSPGKELLSTLVTWMVGFVWAPVIPTPVKLSVWLLKLKINREALKGKLKLETEKGAAFSVGLVSTPERLLLKIAISPLPGTSHPYFVF